MFLLDKLGNVLYICFGTKKKSMADSGFIGKSLDRTDVENLKLRTHCHRTGFYYENGDWTDWVFYLEWDDAFGHCTEVEFLCRAVSLYHTNRYKLIKYLKNRRKYLKIKQYLLDKGYEEDEGVAFNYCNVYIEGETTIYLSYDNTDVYAQFSDSVTVGYSDEVKDINHIKQLLKKFA